MRFSKQFRVYYEHTDAGGVVYHASYLNFLAQARTEFFRDLGVELPLFEKEEGVVFAVRSISIDYQRPARLDDLLEVSVSVKEMRHASLLFEQLISRDETRLCHALIRVASLSSALFKPVPLPESLQDLLLNGGRRE